MKSNEIQVLDPTQEEKRDKGIVINEWEKLTAPSNRQLSIQNLHFLSFDLDWSIDRITIVRF